MKEEKVSQYYWSNILPIEEEIIDYMESCLRAGYDLVEYKEENIKCFLRIMRENGIKISYYTCERLYDHVMDYHFSGGIK